MTEKKEPERKKRRLIRGNMEVFVSVAALITAVAAVVITMEQTKVMREEAALERKNARISVMPSVWLSTFIGSEDEIAYYKVVLTNKGLGPAELERFDVTYKGEIARNWDHLARLMAADIGTEKTYEDDTVGSWRSPMSPGIMLEAGGTAEPLQIFEDTDVDGLRLFMEASPNISLSLCYCSLYGDCFVSELFNRPIEIESCEVAAEPFVSHGFFRQ